MSVSLFATHSVSYVSSCHLCLPVIWEFFPFQSSCHLGLFIIWVFLSLGSSCHWCSCHLSLLFIWIFLTFGSFDICSLLSFRYFCDLGLLVIWVLWVSLPLRLSVAYLFCQLGSLTVGLLITWVFLIYFSENYDLLPFSLLYS